MKVTEVTTFGGVDSRSNAINMPADRCLKRTNLLIARDGSIRLRDGFTQVEMVYPTGSGPSALAEDMLDWWINSSTTEHVEGEPPVNPIYGYLDPDGKKFWLIKNASGNPWDILQYDNSRIYHWITENGDEPGNWDNASGYKRFLEPLPLCPRFFTPGTQVVIDTAGPNTLERTVNCGADSQAPINLGDVRTITSGPIDIDFEGDVGVRSADYGRILLLAIRRELSGAGTLLSGQGIRASGVGQCSTPGRWQLRREHHVCLQPDSFRRAARACVRMRE